jgi:broad specificity phosphatase PhoE
LILARHGETAWNAERRYQGQADVPLNETGRRQAAALAQHLAAEGVHAIYASDLQRAWETATVIAEPHGLPVRSEPRLREIDFGAWDGLTYSEIGQRYPKALAAWEANPLSAGPPGGENLSRVTARVRAALDDVARAAKKQLFGKTQNPVLAVSRKMKDTAGVLGAHQDQTVLLVAHGGSLQVLLCLALGLVPRARWQFRLDAASLSELRLYEEDAVLVRLNDTCHLAAVDDES